MPSKTAPLRIATGPSQRGDEGTSTPAQAPNLTLLASASDLGRRKRNEVQSVVPVQTSGSTLVGCLSFCASSWRRPPLQPRASAISTSRRAVGLTPGPPLADSVTQQVGHLSDQTALRARVERPFRLHRDPLRRVSPQVPTR